MKLLSLYSALLLTLLLNGCGPDFGRYLVPSYLKSSEQRMANLLENKAAYRSQDEWLKAINYTTWAYSSKWWECYSALDCAMKARDLNLATYLLEQGADPNGKPPMKFIDVRDLEYPIQRAIIKARSDAEAAKWTGLLLQYGANPNLASRTYAPALLQAIKRHYPKTIKLLLDHGASTGMLRSVDAPGIYDHVRKKSKPLPRWYNALNTAVRHARDGNSVDQQIVKILLEHGADPFDMSVPESPSLPGFARQQGKPQLAEYSIRAYAEVHSLNATQQADLRKRLIAHDRQVTAEKKAREKRQRQIAQRDATQMIDDSNAWVGAATRLIKETSNQYQRAEQTRRASVTSTTSDTPAVLPQKQTDNSCDSSPYCKPTSYHGRYRFTKSITGKARGYNNAAACERSRMNARPQYECNNFANGKWTYHTAMGVSYEACECKKLEFKSECSTRATWYCGNPDESHSEGVMTE